MSRTCNSAEDRKIPSISPLQLATPTQWVGHDAGSANRHYGPHDPIIDAPRFIWRCQCGTEPRLEVDFPSAEQRATQGGGRPGERSRRHFLMCATCGRHGQSAAKAWQAIIERNRTNFDAGASWVLSRSSC